jgi:hypothetical protein
MNKIYVDPTILTQLGGLDHEVELCDQGGRTLGFFHPIAELDEDDYGEPPMSEEELRARQSEVGGMTTAEVLAYLKSLPPQGNA